ncbi:MAG: aminomethyl transferase family protein [Proteobacteria bacterium]|nr:aminomethyl transferase family protein [Pseudomonadota bacterium]
MRSSPIRELLVTRGARFTEIAGVEVAAKFSSFEEEYWAVRNGVGLTDFSFMSRFRIPEDGLDMLERYASGSVAGIRFGRILHTVAPDDEGFVESDLYIANDDEEFIILGENLVDDAAVSRTLNDLGGKEAGLEDISGSTAVIGLDGYRAWCVVKDLFGPDILGLPYLSLEKYELDSVEVKLLRAGKTSEFGYILVVPAEEAASVFTKIEKAGEQYGLKHVGLETHLSLRLDGRFFNIHAEGAEVKDPLALGLQWMIDFEGEDFRGREAIFERRAAGLDEKIIGIAPADKAGTLEKGDALKHGDEAVARVISASDSPFLGHRIGLALFKREYAYSGLMFSSEDGQPIKTVSLPMFTPKSLTVKLDEM